MDCPKWAKAKEPDFCLIIEEYLGAKIQQSASVSAKDFRFITGFKSHIFNMLCIGIDKRVVSSKEQMICTNIVVGHAQRRAKERGGIIIELLGKMAGGFCNVFPAVRK